MSYNMNFCYFRILDNDIKGLTGRGTIYCQEALIDNIQYYHEWCIFDEINNTQSYQDSLIIKSLFDQRQKEIQKQRERAYQLLSNKVNNMNTNTLSLNPLVFTIDNFLSDLSCKMLIKDTEALDYKEAPVTLDGNKGIFQMMPDVRNNTHVILDDEDLANILFHQLKEHLPPVFKDNWKLQKLNSRFRFYRYEKGQTFKPHIDGKYKESDTCESKLTLLIYLSKPLSGGETTFFNQTESDLRFKIEPQVGQVLVFDHHQLHSGEPVIDGVKYVLRTDVMYTLI